MSTDLSRNNAAAAAWFPPEEFAARRERVYDVIGPEAYAILQGAGPVRGFEAFRQTNEFFYLCGVELPQCYLVLDGARRTASLYLPNRGPGTSSEGELLGAEDADKLKAQTGLSAVYPLESLAKHLGWVRVLYTPLSPVEGRVTSRDVLLHGARLAQADPWDAHPSRQEHFVGLLRERCPNAEIRDISPALDDMRRIKSPREVAACRFAGQLSARAVVEAMKATRPGIREYELEAIADLVFRLNGARSEGYRAILPGGPNVWYGHYFANDAVLQDGDILLMDYAPDVCNYTSDIGRMWPINGRYSPLQRELYGFVVAYHKALLKRIRPGVMARDVMREAAEEMEPVVDSTRWSAPQYEQAAAQMLDFTGHLSHPVGMAVHDVGGYHDRPLEPGLVISVDPQMWVRQERLYVRVEDTGVITESGFEPFTSEAPLELDDVEALMQQPGLPVEGVRVG